MVAGKQTSAHRRREWYLLAGRSTVTKVATGNEAGDYMVIGPDWQSETPPGIKKVFRSSTQFPIARYRTQLLGPEDIDNNIQPGTLVSNTHSCAQAASLQRTIACEFRVAGGRKATGCMARL